MPERPDLEYVVPILDRQLADLAITGVRVPRPVVLRVAVPGRIEDLLIGRRLGPVARRGHFVRFALHGAPALELVVSPMLAGRFTIVDADARRSADLAVALELEGDRELRYRDDVQMGKVYLIPHGAWELIPGLSAIGVDVLDRRAFTRARFRGLARTRRDQAKVFLLDKTALDSLGNAYADEVLFAAGIHPKTLVRSLGEAELDRLHDAIVEVLREACATIRRRKPPLDEKVRDFLNVRGRHGQPCPRCGAKLRVCGVHGHDADFCPTCQPATRKTGIVDWR